MQENTNKVSLNKFLITTLLVLFLIGIGVMFGVMFERGTNKDTTSQKNQNIENREIVNTIKPTASQKQVDYEPVQYKDYESGLVFTIPSGWYVDNFYRTIFHPSEAKSPLPRHISYHYWQEIDFNITPTPMQCQTEPFEILVGTQSARLYYDYDPTNSKECYPKMGGCQENVYVQLPSPHGNTLEFTTCKLYETSLMNLLQTVRFECDLQVCR